MLTKIDWLSFSVKRAGQAEDTELSVLQQVIDIVDDMYSGFWDVLGMTDGSVWRSGRKPYKASFCREDGGVAVFVHPNLEHALVEISGKGCETLSASEDAGYILEAILPRLTRIDLACDMLTDVRPTDFVSKRTIGRFKAHSEVVSESGETCYVGSRTSNRYARVYRYNEPHERAHLLRCEFVLKAEDARSTAQHMLDNGHYDTAHALGVQFGWQHLVWDVQSASETELKAYRPDRREGKTLYWLNDTIAPLIVRLHKEGIIDAKQWFIDNILTDTHSGDTL